MWKLDYKESWAPKNWCFWTVMWEKTLESPLVSKEVQPVNPKGNHSWIFIGRTDAEAETLILWPPAMKSWLTTTDPDAGKDWRMEEKGMTEDEMVGWHHQLDGHESEQAPGVGDGQGSLACCSPWSRKESDMTEWLNWTELKILKPHQWRSITVLLLATLFKCPRKHKWIPNKHNAELEGEVRFESLTLSFISYEGKVGPWGGMTCPRCQRSCRKKISSRTGCGTQCVSNCYPCCTAWYGEDVYQSHSGKAGREGLKGGNGVEMRGF